MRNVKVVVALALLALAGCTSNSTNAPLGSSPSSTTTTTTTTTTASSPASTTLSSPAETQPTVPPPQTTATPLAGGPTEVPAAQIDGGTLPDTYKKQAWTSTDGRTVQVIGLAGGCKTASAEVTAQSGDQVLITLVTTYYPPAGGGLCTQELRDVPLNVTLDAPLGSRRVVLEAREDTA
ncbi:hypothetical protein ALI22I_21880 [Saccharothrix sp. ALI-22-I]|uniref:hypothetical protein n=1 Tax=Saccharothrix sp. ALI-22-I TaxID=1933778 RepID=UPI00097BF393|nr:hypothetical protein [Saccharothrix sp. ALI-22-I]ONI87119.1 hypothetical protein ALI22I_21880 [Saccharothrix sp. ALI-22-I]